MLLKGTNVVLIDIIFTDYFCRMTILPDFHESRH